MKAKTPMRSKTWMKRGTKPMKRTRIRPVRPKLRPGRLKGAALEKLRRDCFERDGYRCVDCGKSVTWSSGHMAHKRNKRMWGDSLDQVHTKCAECHLVKEHSGGKVVPKKPSLTELETYVKVLA